MGTANTGSPSRQFPDRGFRGWVQTISEACYGNTTASIPAAELRARVKMCFQQGKTCEKRGEWLNARMNYQECLNMDPRDAHSWLALARLEARRGYKFLPNARLLFEAGTQCCPENVRILQAWAVMEYKSGDIALARKLFEQGNRIDPANAYVCHAWGLLEQRVGDSNRARLLFEKCLEIRPRLEVCTAWAVLEAGVGDLKRARSLFEEAISTCTPSEHTAPRIARTLRQWAEIEERSGDISRARDLLEKALRVELSSETHLTLARLEARRGSTKRALELMSVAASMPGATASVYNGWAVMLVDQGQVSEALEVIRKGINALPLDPSIFQTYGTIEERQGRIDAARRLYRRSVDLRPTAPAFVAWALLEERCEFYERARALFEKAIRVDPLHGPAYNAYGMMERRCGNLSGARNVYDRGLGRGVATTSLYQGYGQLEMTLGRDLNRSRQIFRQGVTQSRDDASFIWHSWGMLELKNRDPLEARRIFQEARKLYPTNSRILVGSGLAFGASRPGLLPQLDDARRCFRAAVLSDPTHPQGWQCWGVFELRQGNTDAARALFKRGLRLCPGHGALWQSWASLESREGRFARARTLFERGIERCPTHVHLHQAWACMEVRSGNVTKAKDLLDRALKLNASHGPLWTAYGLLESKMGNIDKAREKFNHGIMVDRRHAPLYRTFAQSEARIGNYRRARQIFREGLDVDPHHAPLYHAWAEMEGMLGNVDALAELRFRAAEYFGDGDSLDGVFTRDEAVEERFYEYDVEDSLQFEIDPDSPMENALRESSAIV
mmetsp:Transcript_3469/g.6504  ORF Transcript_3469/g.6504 Transcript_3469/m.6504 type:complete len:786 (+) Transcript_3469:135-2492(+)